MPLTKKQPVVTEEIATVPPEPVEEAAVVAPPEPPRDQLCEGCGGVIVHYDASGAAWLSVYERQLLRPHRLEEDELPLDWRCQQCGRHAIINKR